MPVQILHAIRRQLYIIINDWHFVIVKYSENWQSPIRQRTTLQPHKEIWKEVC